MHRKRQLGSPCRVDANYQHIQSLSLRVGWTKKARKQLLGHCWLYALYTQKLANFMKAWVWLTRMSPAGQIFAPCKICIHAILCVRSAVKPPMDGFTAVFDRHIPYLLFLDGFSIKRESCRIEVAKQSPKSIREGQSPT